MTFVASLLFTTALLLGAPLVGAQDCKCADRSRLKAVAIYHGRNKNPFWQRVKGAAEKAATDMGIDLTVHLFDEFDEDQMVTKIQDAANTQPDFMIASLPGKKVADAVKTLKIPVFTMNAGDDIAETAGSINFVGMPEMRAGSMAAEQLIKALPGLKKGVFIHTQKGNSVMDARSAGMKKIMDDKGLDFQQIFVDGGNDDSVTATLDKELKKSDVPTGILIGCAFVIKPVLAKIQGLGGNTAAITFDTSDEIFQAIKSKKLVSAIDQQEWLQGYLPVVLGTLSKTAKAKVPQAVLVTGPSFVTKPPSQEQADCMSKGKCLAPNTIKVAGVTHADDNKFWDVMEAGGKSAASDLGVQFTFPRFKYGEKFENKMKADLKKFSAAGVALFVTIPNAEMEGAIAEAAKKVPLMSVNTGGPRAAKLGSMNHFAQNELDAGRLVGKQLLADAPCKAPLCVVEYPPHEGLKRRCKGVEETSLAAKGPKVVEVVVDVKKGSLATMKEAMAEEKPDCVILTACSLNRPWFTASADSSAKPRVGGFDLTVSSAAGLVNKSLAAVVDQQAFLQGYLPVLLLTIKTQTGLALLNPWIKSGPRLEDPAEVNDIVACMQKGFPVCNAKPALTLEAFADKQQQIEDLPSNAAKFVYLSGFLMLAALSISALAWRRFKQSEGGDSPIDAESLME